MKKAAKRKRPFELSFHGFTSQKRGSVKAASMHTGFPSPRLGGKFSRERGQPAEEAYPWSSAVSVMVEPQKPPVGNTWKEGERGRGWRKRKSGGEQGSYLISVLSCPFAFVFLMFCPSADNT